MRHNYIVGTVVAIVVLLLAINLFVGGGPDAMVNAARSQHTFADVSAEHMKVARYECNDGRFGFGGHGTVDFGPDEKDPSRVLRVTLSKHANLLGWRVDSAVWHH